MGNIHAKLIAFNTDKKQLNTLSKKCEHILLGASVTKGLGAGGDPKVALKAAMASKKLIERELADADLVFIAAGMGGGTGTGAAPVIAQIAKDHGALVLGIVTFPFAIERSRIKKAQTGTAKLAEACHTLVVIDNNRLVQWVPNLQIDKAFALADEVMAKAVSSISRTILEPSLMNLDFADLRTVMENGGLAMISTGEAVGYSRVEDVTQKVLEHPLLDVDWSTASGALMHLTGGSDLSLADATDVGEKLTARLPDSADVCWGARIDDSVEKKLEAFIIFTGIPSPLLLDPDAGKNKDD
jgi:cell division protein FtsZ